MKRGGKKTVSHWGQGDPASSGQKKGCRGKPIKNRKKSPV